jgi:hypothetical protein
MMIAVVGLGIDSMKVNNSDCIALDFKMQATPLGHSHINISGGIESYPISISKDWTFN